MLRILVIALAGLTAAAQTRIDLRSQAKAVDFTAANSTRPMKTGTALPATCAIGEMFFKTDAPAGSNVYGCAAPNTWSVQAAQVGAVESNGVTVGTRPVTNFVTGSGLMSVVTDTGAEIQVLSALDSAVIQTQPGEQTGAALLCASAGGSATDYSCLLTPAAETYTAGMVLHWKPDVDGAGGPTTLNVDTLGPKRVKSADGAGDPAPGDILAGRLYNIWYDGSGFRSMQTAAAGGGAVASVFGRTGAVAARAGDYTAAQVTNAVDSTANYSNPSWIGSLSWSKIAGAPLFEPAIAAGSSSQYWRGDKSWQTLDTSVVPENVNLYFTTARAQAAMSGLYQTPIAGAPGVWPSFAAVATSGSYNDLSNKPALGGAAALNVGTAAGTVAAGDDARLSKARAAAFTDLFPVVGDSGLILLIDPPSAIHLTRVFCAVQGSTNVVLNLDRRTEGTIGMDSGAHLLGSDLTAVPGGSSTTTFANGSGQCGGTASCAIGAHTPVVLTIAGVSGVPGALNCSMDYTVD